MPWREATPMSERKEFVLLATQGQRAVGELCRRFGISRKTAYKWLDRYRRAGDAGLQDRSRRPQRSPRRTAAAVEEAVIELRHQYGWGGRKISRILRTGKLAARAPAPSTVTGILRRHGLIAPAPAHRGPWQRFERSRPNELWQMDFKGPVALAGGGRCHPLTILDDHSRFAVGVLACRDQTRGTVTEALERVFRRYGLPEALLTDNGPPWGAGGDDVLTRFGCWLLQLGVRLLHSRPYHPQTNGKNERFNGTLQAELLRYRVFGSMEDCQRGFNHWRDTYNLIRPHEALDLDVPAARYQVSTRRFPETLPPIDYGAGYATRKVQQGGRIHFHGRTLRVGKALVGYPVGIRPTAVDGIYEIYFCHQRIQRIDLNHTDTRPSQSVTHVSARV